MKPPPETKQRFEFIDQFRGLVVILMLLDHCSYYFNAIWEQIDPMDPLFDSWGQFALRYAGYLCAPGFLVISGAMVWWSWQKLEKKGISGWKARWQLIRRGLFLVLLQVTWVNSSWGGFSEFRPWHLGIIACIGISMILLTLIIRFHWLTQLLTGLAILAVHPLLLEIPYDPEVTWMNVIRQTFFDAGEFNKYPVLPWFGLAAMGSAMASGWLGAWKTDRQRIAWSAGIGTVTVILALLIRIGRGYGNIFPYSGFGSFSFFFDQKYPQSLFLSMWTFGWSLICIAGFIALNKLVPRLLLIFTIPGRVPLFFYGMHIAIMGVFVKRMDLMYRDGGVAETLIAFIVMYTIMLLLCLWFYHIKRKSKNFFIKMI
ncbi:MAG: heparan-alpha-glucosaminide N-acetyltransferase domain-containing protein [Bacteroidales bacterium]|jgi:uncharacterized membrane protein|nr:heparan-alpha-glucosaminide N-acetyltransferase domain-containing protein [Bacteroidales bacterium]